MEIDIPTDLRERNPNSLIPSLREIAFDFAIVSERIRSLSRNEKEDCNINTKVHPGTARCFHFPHHLGISEPTPKIAMKNPGVLGRLCLGKKQTSRAPTAPLETVPEAKPLSVPIVELSEESEEQLVNTRKR
ncbi:hypothetical protein OROMI_002842 [Orobanche minor]